MLKQFIKYVLFGFIIGAVLSFGVIKYQNDQDVIYCQISQIQRQQNLSLGIVEYQNIIDNRISQIQQQQEMFLTSIDNPLPDLIGKVAPSVVFVEAPHQWSGSGVIVGPHTVLTARHVIRDVNELIIEIADGKKHKAIGWVEDEENDCGLIFFDPREEFKDIVEFVDSNNLQIGDIVFTIGSPFGKQLFNTVTFGIVSGLEREISYFGTCGLITSDAAINPGNSGGPVFDMQGRIIGIVVGTKYGADGLNVIVPANTCKKLLGKK